MIQIRHQPGKEHPFMVRTSSKRGFLRIDGDELIELANLAIDMHDEIYGPEPTTEGTQND